MAYTTNTNLFINLLYQPAYRVWRHLFIVVAIVATTLSQSFFVFGNIEAIASGTIYAVGLIMAVFTLAIIYCNIYFLAPHFLPKRAYASYLLSLLLIVFGLILTKHTVEYTILQNAGIYRKWNGITLLDGISNMILFTVCVASTSVGILFRQLMADNTQIENLESRQLKNNIDELKNRMQPKFLYATLNHASQKAASDPKLASDGLFRLSELLRYQLYDCTRSKVLLAADIKFVQNYLLLHQQNTDNKFSFEVSVNGNTNQLVAPALFTPIIEEVIRHQPEKLVLHINIENAIIRSECKVYGMHLHQHDFNKIKQKLQLIYGDNVTMEQQENIVIINIQLC